MDAARFDRLTKVFSIPQSRRGVLAGVLAGTLSGIFTVRAKSEKIGVCHHTGSTKNPVVFIEVSEHAAKAHEAHGDDVGVDLQTDHDNCGACGHRCGFRQACVAGECINVRSGTCGNVSPGDGLDCQCVLDNGDICANPIRACFGIHDPNTGDSCAVDPCQCPV
jgi:hypothetical protein